MNRYLIKKTLKLDFYQIKNTLRLVLNMKSNFFITTLCYFLAIKTKLNLLKLLQYVLEFES